MHVESDVRNGRKKAVLNLQLELSLSPFSRRCRSRISHVHERVDACGNGQ